MRRIMRQSRCEPARPGRWFVGGDRRHVGRLGAVREQLPIFPLNTVMFPGVTVPLHVFEDRYRALVHHLLTIADKSRGCSASSRSGRATRSATHGVHSVHRVGCVVQMTSVEPYEDGRFDIEVVGRHRLRLTASTPPARSWSATSRCCRAHPDGPDRAARGRAHPRDVRGVPPPALRAARRRRARRRPAARPGVPLLRLAATCLLTLPERQELLEADTALERLAMLRHALHEEMRAMRGDPVAARDRGGAHPLVPQLDHGLQARRGRHPGDGRPDPGGHRLHRARLRARPGAASYGLEAAEALGLDPARVFKTLFTSVDGRLVVGIVPVSGQLDLKAVAAAVGGKKATMADPAAAERATGYVVGGISPLGQKRAHPTVLDASAMAHDVVYVSGGRRGLDLGLSPADLVRVTGATVAPIGRGHPR